MKDTRRWENIPLNERARIVKSTQNKGLFWGGMVITLMLVIALAI